VVLILTGHSLKDADYTIDFHRGELLRDDEKLDHEDEINKLRRNAVSVEPTMDAVLAALRGVVG
jgi:threonine synthase